MSSTLALTITSDDSQALMKQLFQLDANKDREAALALSGYFRDLASKNKRGVIEVSTAAAAPVRATATATLVSCATDTITIDTITFTGSGSPSGEEEFETGGTDTADAAALAAAINAHSTLATLVSATSAVGVVTIQAIEWGSVGNSIGLSETGTTITVSAAALAGGTGGDEENGVIFNCGI